MQPSIAIIIPSLNSPIIDQVIARIMVQDRLAQVQKVVIVGKDDANLIPPNNQLVKFIDTGQPVGASVARNIGIAETDADYRIFLDSDCLPEAGWLTAHIAAYEAGHQVISGSVLPTGDNYWHLAYNLTLFHEILSENEAGERDFLATLNLGVGRTAIDQVGGMDESIVRVEDVDWTTRMRRAGFQPYFWPDAAVTHQHNRTSLRRLWEDCALSGYHMRWLRLHHPDLQSSFLLNYPTLVLLLSPAIAKAVTTRILFKRWDVFAPRWYTLPAIYISKLAWCWGASRKRPDGV